MSKTVKLEIEDLKQLVSEKYDIDPSDIRTEFYTSVGDGCYHWCVSLEFESAE